MSICSENLKLETLIETATKELQMKDIQKVYLEKGNEMTEYDCNTLKNFDRLFFHYGLYSNGDECEIDLCILGTGAVGKSALTFRWFQNKFVEDYDPTIEDLFENRFSIDGRKVLVRLLDTAGQEVFFFVFLFFFYFCCATVCVS